VTVYESGPPFSVVCNLPYPRCDFNADGQSGERVNVRRTDLGRPSREQWLAGVLSAADYSLPAAGTLSTQPRNAFTGPAYFNTDLSVVKSVRIPWQDGRSATLQVRVEAFNVFNAAHLANPVSAVDSPVFGQVRGLRRDPRIIQLGARFSF